MVRTPSPRRRSGATATTPGDDLGPDPGRLAGSVVEVIELDGGRPVRTHLRRLGFRPFRARWRERADWFSTKNQIAHITGFGRATVYVRLKTR